MFYIKTKEGKVIQLKNTNIYTICPCCGEEQEINFESLVSGFGHIDLEGTEVYCEKCAEENEMGVMENERFTVNKIS